MFAFIAAVCFALALILHLVGVGHLVLTFELAGLLGVALHLAVGAWPWKQ